MVGIFEAGRGRRNYDYGITCKEGWVFLFQVEKFQQLLTIININKAKMNFNDFCDVDWWRGGEGFERPHPPPTFNSLSIDHYLLRTGGCVSRTLVSNTSNISINCSRPPGTPSFVRKTRMTHDFTCTKDWIRCFVSFCPCPQHIKRREK